MPNRSNNCSRNNCCMSTKKSSTTALLSGIADCQIKELYPLVSYRIIPLVDLAKMVDMTPGALRKAAQRLGVTEAATCPDNTITFLKKVLRYSYDNGTSVMDYVSDSLIPDADF